MDDLARNHLIRSRDHAARQAEASKAAIAAILDRNRDSVHLITVSDWATIARNATEGAHFAALAKAYSDALDALREA
jgi:hypothetical protein